MSFISEEEEVGVKLNKLFELLERVFCTHRFSNTISYTGADVSVILKILISVEAMNRVFSRPSPMM